MFALVVNMKRKKRLLLTLSDYQRVFRVIYALLQNAKIDTAKACLYFGFIGAAILRAHYQISARAAVGMAIYKLDASNDVLALAIRTPDGHFSSSSGGFHCWVETEGWAVDFSAPLFPEMFSQSGYVKRLPRQMFQRRVDALSVSADDLKYAGDAVLVEDPEFTAYSLQGQAQHAMRRNLKEIAVQWYMPTPKKITPSIEIKNQQGEVVPITLSGPIVTGAW